MAYSASALSFLFKNLTKPIVLTGSQLSISRNLSDGSDNLFGALMIASHFKIPEVVIYFNHKLMRGNRTKKVHTEGFAAFESFNYPSLVDVGAHWDIHWDNIRNPPRRRKGFSVHKNIERNVVVCTLYPGITPNLIRNILAPPVAGCVLQTFGAGNAPLTPEFLAPFKEAISRGVIILNVTQCVNGAVQPTYSTGKALQDIGIIAAFDLTLEAAIAKLAVYLSKEKSREWKISKMKHATRGEFTDRSKREYSFSQSKVLAQLAKALKSEGLSVDDVEDLVPIVLCLAAGQGRIGEIKQELISG
jgi:L-asparaginase/Glu-tRNA(Gln) amidotransferase subunit D